MDSEFSIHRLRIGDYIPSAIKSIAVNPFSNQIAVGKINGEIDIYDTHPSNKLYCYAKIVGMKEFQLQSLVWSNSKSQKNRLFGISLRGFIFEADLALLQIVNIRDAYGGASWAMSISPRDQFLAIGCEDGIVRLFHYDTKLYKTKDDYESIQFNDFDSHSRVNNNSVISLTSNKQLELTSSVGSLSYHASLPTSGSRILSLAFHPVEARIFIGCSDGTVRCMDENTGRVIYRMLGDVLRGSITTMIWSMVVLADSTVVTGDSRGQVQVWDGTTGVLMDSFRQHTADVLAVTASPDGNTIFAAGVDGKVICLQKSQAQDDNNPSTSISPAQNTHWIYVNSHRAHSHDVLSLAICKPIHKIHLDHKRKEVSFADMDQTADSWILISGGIDARLSTYSVKNFVRTRPTWIASIPTNTLVSSTVNNELITLKHNEYVDIWKVSYLPCTPQRTSSSSSSSSEEKMESSVVIPACDHHCQLGLRVNLSDSHHIQSSAISPCGSFLAISSSSGLRVFRILMKEQDFLISLKKMQLPELLLHSSERQFIQAITFYEVVSANDNLGEHTSSISNNKKRKSVSMILKHNVHKYMAVYCAKRGCIIICEQVFTEESLRDNLIDWKIAIVLHHSDNAANRKSSSDNSSLDPLMYTVKKMVFSSNGHYLAVLNSCSPSTVYVYDIIKQKLHWIVPTAGNLVTDVIFKMASSLTTTNNNSSGNNNHKGTKKAKAKDFFLDENHINESSSTTNLIITYAKNLFTVFDIEDCKLSTLLSESPNSLTANIPSFIQELAGPICGITMDPYHERTIILYGHAYCIYVDLDKQVLSLSDDNNNDTSIKVGSNNLALGDACSKLLQSSSSQHEKEEDYVVVSTTTNTVKEMAADIVSKKNKNFIVFNKYRNLLYVNFKSSQELIVIENPWARIMPALPDTLYRKRYGT